MDAFISGAWRTVRRGEVTIGGAPRVITRGEVYRSGTWREAASFIPPLSLNVSPAYVSGIAVTPKPTTRTVYTNYATATPVGGRGPYSYSWIVGGASAETPSNATTRIFSSLGANQEKTGIATVTCTDSAGTTASAQVEYYLSNESNQ